MTFDKTEDGREERELNDVKPFVVMITLCNGVTHPSIKCAEEATQEGPDCNC